MEIKYKAGDVVKCEKVWGDKLFIIYKIRGNEYLLIASSYLLNKPQNNKNMCNLVVKELTLINSNFRPLKNIDKIPLLKMVKKDNIEAVREFKIRVNNKAL